MANPDGVLDQSASGAEDIPAIARRCWQRWKEHTKNHKERSDEWKGFWIGGELQWREGEIAERTSANRPWVTINCLRPVVDQVENEARANPPGPQAHPVADSQATKDGGDMIEGLIREIEYRSDSKTGDILSLRNACVGGVGVIELKTEYCEGPTMNQRLTQVPAPDTDVYFWDPDAISPGWTDGMFAGKVRQLSRDQVIEEFGDELRILQKPGALGWIKDLFKDPVTLQWVGPKMEGPYYVCEFWRVTVKWRKLTFYQVGDDGTPIGYYDDEKGKIPAGAKVVTEDGEPLTRLDPQRVITKHVVTALDEISETGWYGDIIPYFWVIGPEMWRKRERYISSLIGNGTDPQRNLNFSASTITEKMQVQIKSPIIGWIGQFRRQNAQGIRPWDNANKRQYAYLELTPTYADDGQGNKTLLPPPIMNNGDVGYLAQLVNICTFWREMIKAATNVFFDPTAVSAQRVQSGEAIKQLQSQTNIGTLNWQDELNRAKTVMYQQCAMILPKIMRKQQAVTIVQPNSEHETAVINRTFPPDWEVDQLNQRAKNPKTGEFEPMNNITIGRYTLHVTAGPNWQEREAEAVDDVKELLQLNPATLQNPAVFAKLVRWIGKGNPEIESIADTIAPDVTQGASAEQLSAQLQKVTITSRQKDLLIQALQQKIAAKLPDLETRKWEKLMDALTKIRVAEITASKDTDKQQADIEADTIQQMLQMAHETASQAMEHEHDQNQSQAAAENASAMAAQAAAQDQGDGGESQNG